MTGAKGLIKNKHVYLLSYRSENMVNNFRLIQLQLRIWNENKQVFNHLSLVRLNQYFKIFFFVQIYKQIPVR